MAYGFRILNVFTLDGAKLSGNPLCVFEDARGLTTAQMQALARQLNLSETTFVLPSTVADAQVRIFTPDFEMPFAGHPTLGTAAVVANGRPRVTLELNAGVVPVTLTEGRWSLTAPRAPTTRVPTASRAELARMLGLPDDAVDDAPRWVNTGAEQLVIPIRSTELVRRARPVPELLERWGAVPDGEIMAYLVARDLPEWTVRFFFLSGGGVVEDPATGSACANLGGWWVAAGRPLPLTATLRQGDAAGRPSRLSLRVDVDGSIHVAGEVLELGRGSFDL